jgi:glycosyltransferase 2 family protein
LAGLEHSQETVPVTAYLPETAEEEQVREEISLGKRLRSPKTIISFLIAFGIVFFVMTRLDINLETVWTNMRQANPWWLALGIVAYYCGFVVRGYRWQLYLKNAGLHKEAGEKLPSTLGLTEIIMLSWFVNCIVPAKLGDLYRGYLLKKNGRVSFSKTFGTIAAERVVDMLVLFALMSLAGIIAFQGRVPGTVTSLFIMGLIFSGAIALVVVALRALNPWIIRLVPKRFESVYSKFRDGVLQSLRPRGIPVIFGLTLLVWLLECSTLYLVATSLNVHVALSVIIFVTLAASLLTTIPLTPAGLGAVESAVTLTLLWVGIDKGMASSVAILARLITYWSIIVVGLVIYIISRKK